MNDVLQTVCNSVKKACEPLGEAWYIMTADQPDSIVDYYKGVEIRIRARRFGQHAWRCSIRIGNARHQTLQSIVATLRSTDEGVSKQAALTGAFMEAMTLCDLLLDKCRTQA